jgi:hypothetical protein
MKHSPHRPGQGPDPDLRGTDRGAVERVQRPDVPGDFEPRDPDPPGERANVVSGRVGTWETAAIVRDALLQDGFAPTDVEVFYTGPAGRHAVTAIGGDASADAGTVHAGRGAATGGLVGAAAGLAVGAAFASAPISIPVMLTAAAVGAYGGTLVGGVAATEDGSDKPDTEAHPVARPGGVVIAVRTDRADDAPARALARLRAGGAIALERATDARWRDGSWVGWNPVEPYEPIDAEPGTPQA